MKTFLVFKKTESGYDAHPVHSYSSEEMETSSRVLPHNMVPPLADHFECPEGLSFDVAMIAWQEEQTIPAQGVEGEEGYVPGSVIEAQWVVQPDPLLEMAKAVKVKEAGITELYTQMNTDVLTQMAYIFGTTNTDSAAATERTWTLMIQKPEKFVGAGLKAQFEAGGLQIGDDLDTNAKLVAYASSKIDEVEDYGVWRLQRIEQFKAARQALEEA